jgi:hypothetical protein
MLVPSSCSPGPNKTQDTRHLVQTAFICCILCGGNYSYALVVGFIYDSNFTFAPNAAAGYNTYAKKQSAKQLLKYGAAVHVTVCSSSITTVAGL